METLRLLLVLLSQSMYRPIGKDTSSSVDALCNRWTHFLVTQITKAQTLALLCSLLNIVCSYNPVGWMPYGHAVWGDSREMLVEVAAQVLNAVLGYTFSISKLDQSLARPSTESLSARSPSDANGEHVASAGAALAALQSPVATEDVNQFRHYFARLHRDHDFQFLLTGITTLLANPYNAELTYLPSSAKTIDFVEELVLLLWNMLQTNVWFVQFVTGSESATLELVRALLFHACVAKSDVSKLFLIEVCL
jgi:hypothetical protein